MLNRLPLTVEPVAGVWRGSILESVHYGACAESDGTDQLVWSRGDPDLVTTLRSAAKPLQAIGLVTLPGAESLGLSDDELAVCCASHPGTPRHTALVASVLALAGFVPDNLVCGPAGDPPSPLKHGCSGNHAALILTARLLGVDPTGYQNPDHPAQRWIAQQLQAMSGTDALTIAVDGCGVPTFGLSLRAMARAFAALTGPEEAWARLPDAMARYSDLIGSGEWIDVRLMQVTSGRIVAKTGAEGLLCAARRSEGKGIAIKIIDGSTRALGAFAVKVLVDRGWITPDEAADPLLQPLVTPRYVGPDGSTVGEVRAF